MKEQLKNATIVDVRTPHEYAQEHYPGAINIPVDQVVDRIHEFRSMKRPIVTYCRSGNRSGLATALLKQNGLQEVYNGGGLEDLKQ